MALHLVPDLIDLHGHQTARALRKLADCAERGELLGVALVALKPGRATELQLAGVYERAPELAHFGVSQLLDALLYPGG